MEEFLPQFQAAGLTSYSPRLKSTPGETPPDPFGPYKVNGKPSLTPAGDGGDGGTLTPSPEDDQQIPQPPIGELVPFNFVPPLAADLGGVRDRGKSEARSNGENGKTDVKKPAPSPAPLPGTTGGNGKKDAAKPAPSPAPLAGVSGGNGKKDAAKPAPSPAALKSGDSGTEGTPKKLKRRSVPRR